MVKLMMVSGGSDVSAGLERPEMKARPEGRRSQIEW